MPSKLGSRLFADPKEPVSSMREETVPFAALTAAHSNGSVIIC